MIATSVISTKGGAGKTTTTANLGAICADAGLKTLLIDLDPVQPSLSSYYELPEVAQGGIYDLLAANITDPMSLAHGGHLTHGAKVSSSGKLYNAVQYGLDTATGLIDYDEVERLAVEHKPKMIVAGFSAYSKTLDFPRFRAIADKVGALLFVDMAHVAGLVAAGLYPNPIPFADVFPRARQTRPSRIARTRVSQGETGFSL